MITKLNRGRNARRVINKICPLEPPVERLLYENLNTWGCYIMSTQVRCGCEDTYCTIYELLLGQYWFKELHTTSYYTKWSAVIVLLHLTFPGFFCIPGSFFRDCLVFFKFKNTWANPFNIIDTCTNSVCANLYY